MSLFLRSLLSIVALLAVMGALILGVAGTIHYPQAWAYLGCFGLASLLVTLDLLKHDRPLLERRMRGGPQAEKERSQQFIMSIASLGFISLLVIPAIAFRHAGSSMPWSLAALGDIMQLVGFFLVDRVFHANSYTAATVQVETGQRVVSTGPYGIVRHPMYASALVYVIGTPLALGSYFGFIGVALMLPALIWRLLDEERVLSKELPGYREYIGQVRYRLIPHIW